VVGWWAGGLVGWQRRDGVGESAKLWENHSPPDENFTSKKIALFIGLISLPSHSAPIRLSRSSHPQKEEPPGLFHSASPTAYVSRRLQDNGKYKTIFLIRQHNVPSPMPSPSAQSHLFVPICISRVIDQCQPTPTPRIPLFSAISARRHRRH
jgi:hypothetical protein